MKKRIVKIIGSCLLLAVINNTNLEAQTDSASKSSFKVTADIVSSYVWRGVNCPGIAAGGNLITMSPNIQPTFAFTAGSFEIGAWASTDFAGGYKEVDPYVTLSAGPLTFSVTDYNWTFKNRYFDFKNKETDHIIEGSLLLKKSAISVLIATMLYGADKKYEDGALNPDKQNYSTYVELGYSFTRFNLFLGATPTNGYYGAGYGVVNGFGIVNLGLSSSKSLKISDKYELPLKATFGVNPQAETAYLVFGITF
jgi:hypothetical protein